MGVPCLGDLTVQLRISGKVKQESQGREAKRTEGSLLAVGLPLPNIMIPQLEHTFSETSCPTAKIWHLTHRFSG